MAKISSRVYSSSGEYFYVDLDIQYLEMEFATGATNDVENTAFCYQVTDQYTTAKDLGLHTVGERMDPHVLLRNMYNNNNLASDIANVYYLQSDDRTLYERIWNAYPTSLSTTSSYEVCSPKTRSVKPVAVPPYPRRVQSQKRFSPIFEHTRQWQNIWSVYTCRSWPPVHTRDTGIPYIETRYNRSSPTTTRCYVCTTGSIQTPYRLRSCYARSMWRIFRSKSSWTASRIPERTELLLHRLSSRLLRMPEHESTPAVPRLRARLPTTRWYWTKSE